MESQETIIDLIEEKVKAQRELPRALMNLEWFMNEDDLLRLREIENKYQPSGNDYTRVDQPYFTTSGDTPIIRDKASQNDIDGTVPEDFYNSDDWDVQNAEARYSAIINQYRKQAKQERIARFATCWNWLKQKHSKETLIKARNTFLHKLSTSQAECAEKKDWLHVYMTKEQANQIKAKFAELLG